MSSLTPHRAERPRILLVEDDAPVRRSLQLLLQAQGYDVRAYATAVGLTEKPEALGAACLVTDLVMPEVNAIELLRNLRAAGWNGRAILVSGHLTKEWSSRAEMEGFDAVLAKPIADSVLTSWIGRLVSEGPRKNGKVERPSDEPRQD